VLDPTELLLSMQRTGVEPDLVLIQALGSQVDEAGSAVRLTRELLLESFADDRIVTYDVDQLHDYRARRPMMVFDADHWETYLAPDLSIHRLHDASGTAFLLLGGPEPDVQWERFVAATRLVIDELKVRLTVGLHAVPMALPHTRGIPLVAHGSRTDLMPGATPPPIGRVVVPSTAGHLIELRLREAGHDTLELAAMVPHYLADIAYPDAALALLAGIERATGLSLPSPALQEKARATREDVDRQVAANANVGAIVRGLEEEYDRRAALTPAPEDIPTGDELGAAFERFLADQDGEPPA
jgi:hypothetical protein